MRIPDLILNLKLGERDYPKGVDREEFLKYLKELSDAEERSERILDRTLSRKQADLIVFFTSVIAFSAAVNLLISIIEKF